MEIIYEQTNVVNMILQNHIIKEDEKYRKIFYLAECLVEGGCVVLNTLTYEMVFLNNDEFAALNNPDMNDKTARYLAQQHFLVPEDFDDLKLAEQVINARVQIQNIYTNPPLSFFVILTTTGCNARCFYCFEQGAKVSNMTEQTARDVADFIKRKADKKIRIQWFGGEPLINTKVIDIICNDLKQSNIDYESTMVTNGYLLDEKIIEKCLNLWKMNRIQISLDGTEEIYNKTKNYVYKNVSSPFKRVLNNIENALKAGLQTSIRLNMDEHNAADLFSLSKMLVDRFNAYNNCHIYVVRLFEDTCSKIKNRDVADRHKLIENSIKLQKFIDENMPAPHIDKLSKSFKIPNTCMANSDKAVMIVPDGHLGKCEHYVDSNFFGSIYSDEYDLEKIARFKERKVVSENCEKCELRSLCLPLKCCGGIPNHCDSVDKAAMLARLHSKMTNIYNKFVEVEAEGER